MKILSAAVLSATFCLSSLAQVTDSERVVSCGPASQVPVYRSRALDPGASFATVAMLACGDKITVLSRDRSMSKVRTLSGVEGWVFNYTLTDRSETFPADRSASTKAESVVIRPITVAQPPSCQAAYDSYDEELIHCREAIRMNPKDAHLHYNLAGFLFNLDRFEEAALSYREVVKLDPKSYAAQYNLGLTLRILHRNEEAANAFRQAVGINPENAQAHSALGSVLGELGRHAEATAAFERALKIDPGYFDFDEVERKAWERSKALSYKTPTDTVRASSPSSNPPRPGSVRPPDTRIVQTGSGFLVTDDGYFLTAAHVVSSGTVSVKTAKGEFVAQVVRVDTANDIAVLKASGSFASLPLGNSASTNLGKSVFTIGYPNIGIQGTEPKFTRGEINALSGFKDDPRHFQTSTQVQPGNSGGPLVDEFGNVIGVVVAKLDAIKALSLTGDLPQNVNYAIKSNYAKLLLETIPGVKLSQPYTRSRPFEEVVKQAESAAVLIFVKK